MIKNLVIGNCMKLIQKERPEYTTVDLEKIEYGLVGVYLLIPKIITILILAQIIGMFSEIAAFMLIHAFMKMHTFGMHATKSWVCFIVSLVLFIAIPWLALSAKIAPIFKYVLGIIAIALIYKNCPADTHKKPIVNEKKRRKHKLLATLTAIIFVTLSLTLNNQFLANCFLLSLTIQVLLTSPVTYSIFKQPFNNYLRYSRS